MTQKQNGMETGVAMPEAPTDKGDPMALDFDNLPTRLLLCGTVGMGKSVTIAYALRALAMNRNAGTEDGLSDAEGADDASGNAELQSGCADSADCPE